jgi:hypothetical protein
MNGLNDALENEIGNRTTIYFSYEVLTRKVTVHLKAKCTLVLGGKISLILGFGGKDVLLDTGKGLTHESPHAANRNNFSTIYTYCDIVKPQIVGDVNAQLLRSIPVEGKHDDIVTNTFTNIQYVSVQTKSFGDVEVLLRNDTGNPVPFERGKVVTTLHFKQRSYFV